MGMGDAYSCMAVWHAPFERAETYSQSQECGEWSPRELSLKMSLNERASELRHGLREVCRSLGETVWSTSTHDSKL